MTQMTWRSKYGGSSGKLTISREMPIPDTDKVVRRYTNVDMDVFLQTYNKVMWMKKQEWHSNYVDRYISTGKGGQYLCWNEKLPNAGRIVGDIDLEAGTSAYDGCMAEFPDVMTNPRDLLKAILIIIIDALDKLGRHGMADIMRQRKIEWYSANGLKGKVSPICYSTCMREGKVSIHFTLPFYTCMESVQDLGYVKEYVYDDRHSRLLRVAMGELYEAINTVARDRFPWLGDDNLLDMSLLTRNHDLRLPGFTKFKHLGRPECELRMYGRHKIHHALSYMPLAFIPKDLYWVVTEDKLALIEEQEEDISLSIVNDDACDGDLDNVWELVQSAYPMIHNNYTGLKVHRDGSRLVYQLIPRYSKVRCCTCNAIHDNNIPYVTMFNGMYWMQCWQWHRVYKHKKDAREKPGTKCIGFYGDDSDAKVEWLERVLERGRTLSTPLYTRSRCINSQMVIRTNSMDLDVFPRGKDLYTCSPMGTGKTNGTFDMLEEDDPSYLLITNRTIQARRFHERLDGSVLYGTMDDWEDEDQLVLQLESLYKCRKFDYQYLVIDEVETILRLLVSDTLRGKELATINAFMRLVSGCDHLICIDAFLKQETVTHMLKLRQGKEYRVVINDYPPTERSGPCKVLMYKGKDMWLAKMKDDSRRKVCVCMSKRIAGAVGQMLADKGESTLVITADTPGHIKNEDPNTLWGMYHNIVYTASIANSVSFVKEHFQVRYVYCCTGSCSPEDLIQMMGRVRIIEDTTVHMYTHMVWTKNRDIGDGNVRLEELGKCGDYLPVSSDSVRHHMKTTSSVFKGIPYKPAIVDIWDTMVPWVQDTYARVYADRGMGQRNFEHILTHIMEEVLGWQVCMDVTYDNSVRLSIKSKDDPRDMEEYDTYIASDYSRRKHLYRYTWCAHNKIAIKNLALIRRGKSPNGDTHIARALRYDIESLFSLGKVDLTATLAKNDHELDHVQLRYDSSERDKDDNILRDKVRDVCIRLARRYDIDIPSRRLWEWIGKFLSNKLLIEGVAKRCNGTKNRTYIYDINLHHWIYWYIVVDDITPLSWSSTLPRARVSIQEDTRPIWDRRDNYLFVYKRECKMPIQPDKDGEHLYVDNDCMYVGIYYDNTIHYREFIGDRLHLDKWDGTTCTSIMLPRKVEGIVDLDKL